MKTLKLLFFGQTVTAALVIFGIVLLLYGPEGLKAADKFEIVNLRAEYKTDPVGIDILQPRLSWEITASKRNWVQSAYQIRVASSVEGLSRPRPLWDTGREESGCSGHVIYAGPGLVTGQRVFWQVRVWDQDGNVSSWSKPAFWEMGLLRPEDWIAEWIQADLKEDTARSNPPNFFRKTFTLRGPVKSARAYVTCHGLYEMELNGRRAGDQVLTPGWTSYDNRLQYQTYDVTDLLKRGENACGVTVGDGWFRGVIGWADKRNVYGKKAALILQIRVEYRDGSRETIATDGTWKASTGPILMSDIYHGETYDARLEKKGWSSAGFDDSGWARVKTVHIAKVKLIAPEGPPVRRVGTIRPVRIFESPKGETLVDMGQNMVGWIRLTVKGKPGQTVVLKHAEVLDKDGSLYTGNLRAARQTIRYTLKGEGREVFEPHFTFQGFRYVQVEGYPGTLTPESLTGVVVHSGMTPTGDFSCSDSMINQLQHNIQWGQKGNFVDVPTDCPQRDERMGWTGDAQVFARTACFNADAASFYTKWLKDVAADQQEAGQIPHVIPDVLAHGLRFGASASSGWADAAVIVPWTVYLSYGDTRILETQYPSMKKWVDYMRSRAGESNFYRQDFTFGDWLAFATTRSDYPGATTDKDFITQAYFARSTDILRRTAAVLGKTEDAAFYADLLKKIKTVFNREFVTATGRLSPNTQTAYAMALAFDLLPPEHREAAAARLAEQVNAFKHITTGFLGAPLICPALTDYGYYDEAFMLLNRKEYPSWLYPITRGATTIWERWDGIKPDGSFQDAGMNSFNHYAYGAIGEWLYRVVAGIEIDENQPGYRHIIFQPHPGGGLTSAEASVHSMYGKVACSWKASGKQMTVEVTIPPNTTATVRLPGAKSDDVKEGGKPLNRAFKDLKQTDTAVSFTAGSGTYVFTYTVN